MTLKDLHKEALLLKETPPMPVLFVGHGTPMNAIEDNEFVDKWIALGKSLMPPQAILCISAHWETRGTYVTAMEQPRTIHDFYGFPDELYRLQYPAGGSAELADAVKEGIPGINIERDYEWGLDHGCWAVIKYLYPEANIPVVQLSIDRMKDARWHYELGQQLAFLRRRGVLIVGSGNMIHNLRMLRLVSDDFNAGYGYDWALEINDILKQKIADGDYSSLISYPHLHSDIRLAIPTPEHYIPLLYSLALRSKNEDISIFNDKLIAGSLSMTSIVIGG